ncbi:sigma-54-dependent transcriptional regulator [Rufibacter glacialis]|uniref:Sigma-54-dependent Fis family transcriptional regulator n=1 Tax=Rufibacter glacialis TaxID=1259555 RepID=A0A5M8QRX6_9BACT|nr:sigma-54 dependent transcriptional regulator [Rufibacter glacialis]KAA6437734.1 sigma-54-dependent Fis family transcriptional regulator [Rufibacter glacialis]GGK56764.1 acetoacetate metabolism regulatory protein AtoC [Rufibacter glacialis]
MSSSQNDSSAKIFVLEDDIWYSQFLSYHLSSNPDHQVEVFNSVTEFLARLTDAPTIITLDYHLPTNTGEEVLLQILQKSPKSYVIIISGQEDIRKAVSLLKMGAYDYIVKNEETKDRLWSIVEKIKHNKSLQQELEVLRNEVKQKYSLGSELVGSSEPIKKVFQLVEKAAANNINVTVTGETGTGKELIAKAIHQNSRRSKMPFVAVNIAALPSELLESELFGHEKGAFTGATARRIGKFEEANGGTLFLDEIGEMSFNLQAKLLRVLQEREVTPVGSNKSIPVEVRIVTATHRNLMDEVKKGNFREDLFYRLLGIQVHLPPLRERGHDILLIANKFLRDFCKQNEMEEKVFTPEAQKKLLSHPYPGNVRELKAVVELAAVLADSRGVTEGDIQLQAPATPSTLEEKTLDEYIHETVQHYLDKYNYNVIYVADKLKVGKSTIYRMIQKGAVLVPEQKRY